MFKFLRKRSKKKLVVFIYTKVDNGISSYGYGNAECKFNHMKLTINDVRDTEKELKEKFELDKVWITNWLELSEE